MQCLQNNELYSIRTSIAWKVRMAGEAVLLANQLYKTYHWRRDIFVLGILCLPYFPVFYYVFFFVFLLVSSPVLKNFKLLLT